MHKIEIYTPDNTDYEYAGNATLIGEASLVVQLNGTWELAVVINHDDAGAWKLLEEESVLRVYTFLNKYQLFRVYDVQPSESITYANARPIFMDAGDEVFLIAKNSDGTAQQHLDVIYNDSKYSATTDIIGTGEATYDMVNGLGAISGDEGFISIFGGEIIYDNYMMYIYEQIGDNLGLTVELGRNMTGIKVTKNTDNMVTRIIPVAYNGRVLPEEHVESPYVNNYAKIYTTTLDCSDLKLVDDCSESEEDYYETEDELYAAMRERAAEQFDGIIDIPTFTYEITFIDLANTDGYEDVQSLITAHLGDTIVVRNKDLDLFLESRVIELTWDCVRGETESIVLGEYDPTIIDSSVQTSNTLSNVTSVLDSTGSVMASQISGVLSLLNTSLRYQKNAAQTLDIRAMLLEDINPDSELFGAISVGTQGVQISKERNETDTDWEWGTAINFESVNANYILTGILSDRKGNFVLDLDKGTFYSSNFDEYTKTEDLNQDLASVYLSISNLQAQVDGEINSWFYAYSPTLTNYPASEWTTDEEKARHVGDTFTNITEFVDDTSTPDAGKSWRYVVTNNVYSWAQISDSDAVKALQDAAKAQGTADGKTTTYSSQPTSYSINDMWVLASTWNGYEAGTILMSSATSTSFVSSHWTNKLSYTTESVVTAAISVAKDSILLEVSNSYVGDGEISSKISLETGTITISSNRLVLDSTYFKVSSTGVITATSGTIGGWTISSTALYTGGYGVSGTRYFGSSGLSLGSAFKVSATGELTCTSGTFSGTLSTTANATVGQTLYVGTQTSTTDRSVYLGSSGRLSYGATNSYVSLASKGHLILTSYDDGLGDSLGSAGASRLWLANAFARLENDTTMYLQSNSIQINSKRPVLMSSVVGGRYSGKSNNIYLVDMIGDCDYGIGSSTQAWLIVASSWAAVTNHHTMAILSRTGGSNSYNYIDYIIHGGYGPSLALNSDKSAVTITWWDTNGGTYSVIPLLRN